MRWLALLVATSTVSLHVGQTVVLPNAKLGDRISCSGFHGRLTARVTSRRTSIERDYLQLSIRPLFQGGVAAQCEYTLSPSGATLGFEPVAATFATPQRGWELGEGACRRCVAVRRTTDGGRTWQPLPSQRGVTGRDVRFADESNGFLFGPTLYVTHSGGRSWLRADVPPVQQIEVGGGYAFAMTTATPPGGEVADLWRSRVGSDDWRIIGQFSAPYGTRLSVEGAVVAVLQPASDSFSASGTIWASRTSGERWGRYRTPCRVSDGSASALTVAVGDPNRWLVDCYDGLQSQQEQHTQHHLFECTRFGRVWHRVADPSSSGGPDLLAAVGATTILFASQGAADELHASFDGGDRFQLLFGGDGSDHEWPDLGFVDRRTGFLVRPTVNGVTVYRTDDGGRHWRTIDVG